MADKHDNNSRRLTDAELAKLLEQGGRENAEPDFEKLVERAAKPVLPKPKRK